MKPNTYTFKKALPIWEDGKENEMNYWLRFRTIIQKTENAILNITGSTNYIIKINGNFVSFGPARCCHGYYRVDEIDISKYLVEEKNIVTILVMGYNINNFYTLLQPSFLCAEIISNNNVIAYTGDNSIVAEVETTHEQKVEKYSYQRTFCEVYNCDNSYNDFYTLLNYKVNEVKLAIQEEKAFIYRDSYLNIFDMIKTNNVIEEGTYHIEDKSSELRYGRHIANIGEVQRGFLLKDVTTDTLLTARNIITDERISVNKNDDSYLIKPYEYKIFKFEGNITGELTFDITVKEKTEIILTFDEILNENEPLNFRRGGINNILIWRLEKGSYSLSTIEPYTMQYLRVITKNADIEISNVAIRYFGANKPIISFNNPDEKLKTIYDAAVQTYRQNTFTIYMDCPSRERAGWLCDSFFTSRVEKICTKKSEIEKVFIQNFLLPDKFDYMPDGEFPMCYPSDHYNGSFIPNWSMWFVLQLEEYLQRTGDRETIDGAKDKVYNLLKHFATYENEDGLLEKLDGWIFVEWSKSNDFIYDVNYPTNMLYSKLLKSVYNLYGDKELLKKSTKIANTINEQSFKDGFYCDNSVRNENGKLELSNEFTESCQYYAFFTGIATKESRPELWNKLLNDFGPERIDDGNWPNLRKDAKWQFVHPSNAFIGDYLRLELLCNNGEYALLEKNIKDYFYGMAQKTGTLWENETATASCNHGFASHVIYWFNKLGYIE